MKLQQSLFLILFFLLKNLIINAQTPLFDSLKNNVQIAIQKQDRNAEAFHLERLAQRQAEIGSIYEALHNVERAIDLYHSLGEKSLAYQSYGTYLAVHQQLHNGDKIIDYALPALKYAEEIRDTQLILHMKNALGIGYKEKGKHAQGAAIFLECLKLETYQAKSSTTYACANVSSSMVESGEFENGLKYAHQTIKQAIEERDTFVLAIAYICEAYALAKLGRADEAQIAVNNSENLSAFIPEAVLDRDLAMVKHLTFAAKGDFKNAYLQHILYHKIDSTLSSGERSSRFAQLETVYKTKEKEVENAQLSARLTKQKIWIAGCLGLLILVGFAAWLQRKQLIIKSKLYEAEQLLSEKERQRAAEEKTFFQGNLNEFMQLLIEKNNAIEILKQDINAKVASTEKPEFEITPHEAQNLSTQLMEATILTEAEWRNFRQKFERVHPSFFDKFGQAVPEATEAEVRLAALTKLQMTNDEIASMLGISPESVTKTRYRLRKKLGERDLGEVLRDI
jgi:hypothetical protein